MKVKVDRQREQALRAWMDWLLYTPEGRRELERRVQELGDEERRERADSERRFIGFPWGAE